MVDCLGAPCLKVVDTIDSDLWLSPCTQTLIKSVQSAYPFRWEGSVWVLTSR